VDIKQLNLLICEGENLTTEFKQKYSSQIDEDIVAFANTKGGILLLGISDEGVISGEKLTNELKGRIISLGRNCKPSITPNVKQVGKVVVIEVPEGYEKPYSCRTGFYRRLSGSTNKMSRDELRIMFSENEEVPYEEKIVKGFSLDDISKAKIRMFAKEAGITIGKVSASDFLKSMNIADKETVKNAGILFFAKNVGKFLPQSRITLLAFKGTGKVNILDRKDVEDDLLTQFKEAILFIKKHLNVRSEIKGVEREDIYEIPLEAIREAVVNALMHRDYGITGSQVQVEVYDDRLEIINPGGLPRGLAKDEFGKISVRRNELISDMFFRLHKVERIGMGIQRMKDILAGAGLKQPKFEMNGLFRIVFHRQASFGRGVRRKGSQKKFPEKVPRKGSQKTSQKILGLMASQPKLTISKLAEALGISQRAVKKHLQKLQEHKMLKRKGSDRSGYWQVLNKGGS
jgi:ATP-dependent DNA helicase RecG